MSFSASCVLSQSAPPPNGIPAPIIVVLAAAAVVVIAALLIDRRCRGLSDQLGIGLLRWINSTYLRLFHGVPRASDDPFPSTGSAIVVANHRSAIDPFVIQYFTQRVVRFMMAREYYETFGLQWIFRRVGAIPVRRDGNDFAATKIALRALQKGEIIGIFPEGGIRNGEETSLDGLESGVKRGAAMLALRTGAPVIAAYLTGTPPNDSVALAFFSTSKSRVFFGAPQRFETSGEKPSKEDLERVSARIVGLIKDLRAAVEAQPGDEKEEESRATAQSVTP